jgi:putative ABC transport system ATP-binding protein
MATASDTSLLLLDEPTAALDPKSAEIVMKNAEQIIKTQKLTAFMVTHNLQHAVDYGDRIIFMRNGEIMHDVKKNKNETLSISTLRAFFEQ